MSDETPDTLPAPPPSAPWADDNASATRVYRQGNEFSSKPWAECEELAAYLARVKSETPALNKNATAEELRENLSPYALEALGHREFAFARSLERPVFQEDDAVTRPDIPSLVPLQPLAESSGDGDTFDNPGPGVTEPEAGLE